MTAEERVPVQRAVCALVRARLEDGWWPTRAQLEVLLSAVEQDGPGRDRIVWWGPDPVSGADHGFDVAAGLPVIAHVYRNSSDSEELPFGWDLTVGIGSFSPGTVTGGDVSSIGAGRAECEAALAGWLSAEVAACRWSRRRVPV